MFFAGLHVEDPFVERNGALNIRHTENDVIETGEFHSSAEYHRRATFVYGYVSRRSERLRSDSSLTSQAIKAEQLVLDGQDLDLREARFGRTGLNRLGPDRSADRRRRLL